MTDNLQTKVFFGFLLLVFFVTGRIYYLNNLTPEAKQEKKEAEITASILEAGEFCVNSKGYLTTTERNACVYDYLVNYSGYSDQELNKYAISQEKKRLEK